MKYKVAIVGSGQLGSRHLQGLIDCKIPLNITVIDSDVNMLNLAQKRWNEVSTNSNIHAVKFINTFNNINENYFDILILASTARGRANLIADLSTKLKIQYWVIEKVLAQSEAELDLILKTLKSYSGVWVNLPRRMSEWYQEIITATPDRSPIICTISGANWGLGTSSVHFLDMVAWYSNEEVISIQTDELATQWKKSKRDGYWECFGTLKATYSGGSMLVMKCDPEGEVDFFTDIKSLDYSWHIKDLEGIALRSDGISIPGRLELQSEMTGKVVESILNTGSCNLTNIKESVAIHVKLINALLEDWNSVMVDKKVKLPIT